MRLFNGYACVWIDDVILFFGGYNSVIGISTDVHKYCVKEQTWMRFEKLCQSHCSIPMATMYHVKTNVMNWMKEPTEMEKRWMEEEEERVFLKEIKSEFEAMNEDLTLKKLKVGVILLFYPTKNCSHHWILDEGMLICLCVWLDWGFRHSHYGYLLV
ncbi:hypothetical protein RFI_22453 [Reticulomyxa filosa]|uniref:Uncharacterized protein n=1 Tax=Reticulomyxa filosa TaxID=46433 RepID=X6MPD5_RETFI|nr:hypothetical protein RFI_22453 [Reticulomyxa filosa]|eukprot:ETO14920.1 hypothetical protein RFI_22453 [Reticulomyxa filosa]